MTVDSRVSSVLETCTATAELDLVTSSVAAVVTDPSSPDKQLIQRATDHLPQSSRYENSHSHKLYNSPPHVGTDMIVHVD